MKNLFVCLVSTVILSSLIFSVQPMLAQGAAFTYQGQLQNNGSPAGGNYDFTFALFNTNISTSGQLGGTLTNLNLGLTNGLFTVTLDFGADFPGANRWLAIAVRTNGGTSFTALNPLQPLTPTPYAIYAPNAGVAMSANTVAATNVTGSFSPAQLPAGLVTNTQTGVTLSGVFSGNGGGLTNLNASQLVIGSVATRVLPGFQSSSNYDTIGGGNNNINNGASGATIAGGANNLIPSGATGNQSTIGGGYGNTNNGNYATIAGGFLNNVNGVAATAAGYENQATNAGAVVSGGGNNVAGGLNSVIGGGAANQATWPGSVIGGGYNNTNYGTNAVIGGGNYNLATNSYATVPGGLSNIAGGLYSFAAGQQAQATNAGSFVWADSQNSVFTSTNTNQFSVRANGGVVFSTSGAGVAVDGVAVITAAPGAIQSYEINDGGASAYQTFQQAIQAMGGDTTLTFSNIFPVAATNGSQPSFILTVNGSALGTVVGFSGSEGMSQAYSYAVEVSIGSASVSAAAEIGTVASLAYTRNGHTTTFGGVVTGCTLAASTGSTYFYTVQIQSQLSYLALNTGYQIFQSTTGPNAAQKIYQSDFMYLASQNLISSYTLRNYTEYGETDLNFFNRILENEGVFYFFNQSVSPPGLIMGDATSAYLASPNSPFSYYGNTASNVAAGTEYVRTFQNGIEQSTYKSMVGASGVLGIDNETAAGVGGVGAYNEFGNSVATAAYDQQLATNRVGIQTAARSNIAGAATTADLRAGYNFTLTDQTGAGLSGSYVVTAIHHAGFVRVTNGVSTFFYGNEFTAIPAATVYRSPLKTPKPQMPPCTGTVVATAGESILVDTYGRVKVLFDWDKADQGSGSYAGASAWVRVASPWAHDAYGAIFLPRAGDQVMVSFLNGDPDEPVVTGSLYNSVNAVPYSLPDNKNTTGIKTQSTSGSGYNELSFDDTFGSENYLMHAQKDMNINVVNNFNATVSGAINLTSSSQTTVNGPLSATGATSITGALTASGGTTVTGGMTVTGSPLTVNSTAALQGGATVTGGLTVSGNPLTVTGTSALSGPVNATGGITANSFLLSTSAGTLSLVNDSGVVPGIIANGGLSTGHLRLRNALEIWPNTAQTNAGYLDVRSTNGNIIISLTGATGAIVCSNITASGVLYSSDRNAKQNFTPLDPEAILAKVTALPVTEWSYKTDPTATKHIGPMAQDFHDAFGLDGSDDKHISVVDEGGVALSAIQGLNQKLNARTGELQQLKEKAAKVDSLEKRLSDLEKIVQALSKRK